MLCMPAFWPPRFRCVGVVDGCPIGLSLMAKAGRDRALIGLARATILAG
jgi:Asp-tRNA(Asn)/Glu-tRNA(Gln) amidotransferase A subunit family amidase